MTTQIYSQDISVFNDSMVVKGISINFNLNNTGAATLNTTVKFLLVQNIGQLNETETILQLWTNKGIAPSDEISVTGTYNLNSNEDRLIVSELNNPDLQTLKLTIDVTGGSSNTDRNALVVQPYIGAKNYSIY